MMRDKGEYKIENKERRFLMMAVSLWFHITLIEMHIYQLKTISRLHTAMIYLHDSYHDGTFSGAFLK